MNKPYAEYILNDKFHWIIFHYINILNDLVLHKLAA